MEKTALRVPQDAASVMRTFTSTYLFRHTAGLFFAILICAIAEDGRSLRGAGRRARVAAGCAARSAAR